MSQGKASIFRDQGCAVTVTDELGLSNVISSIREYKVQKEQTGTQKRRSKDVHCLLSLKLLPNM